MELLVGALVEMMDESEPHREIRGIELDEALAARCTAL